MKSAAFLLLVWAQDDAAIAEWIRQLGDDAVDVREQAAANLARAGRASEKRLREALKSPNEEVRGRAAELLADFDRADRLREFDAGPSRVTLRRDRVPLREVLEEVQKQTRTRLNFAEAPLEDRVSISAEGEPLFRALDALCRAHGKIELAVESRRGDNVIATLSAGPPSRRPHFFHDQYLLVLESVRTTTSYDLAGGSTSRMRLSFRWAWEKGTRPLSASLRLSDVVDDAGKSYAEGIPKEENLLRGAILFTPAASVSAAIELPFAPPATVERLSVVKGDLELTFPEAVMAATFDSPEQKASVERRGGGGSVKLLYCRKEGGKVRARLEVRPPEVVQRLEMKAVDKAGKEFGGRSASGQGDEEKHTLDAEFTMPAEAELAALKVSAPTGAREKKVPFELRDLRIR